MTAIEITTGSKSEAEHLTAQYSGQMQRAGLWRWKVTIHVAGAVDLDAVAATAREMGLTVHGPAVSER